MMRVLVFTGKGGVGTTTAAAATGTAGATRGLRTLVVSTDAAHSLGDVLDARVGPDPTEVDDRLYAQQVDPQRLLEHTWSELGEPLATALAASPGVMADQLRAAEAVVLPGLEELVVLRELRAQLHSGRWDLVVVDGAPTAHALRLLALPDNLLRYLERLFADQHKTGALRSVPDVPELVGRLEAELRDLRDRFTGRDASVRLVLTPESVVAEEARRAYTALALHGYRVDGVIANRLFSTHEGDAWRRQWNAAQDLVLTDVEQSFGDIPIYRSPYRSCEPIGLGELAAFAAEAYGQVDPFLRPSAPDPVSLERDAAADGSYELRCVLPHTRSTDLALARRADQLVLTIGSYRRVFTLPAELRYADVVGASLLDGQLVVRFGPSERSGLDLPAEPGARAAGRGAWRRL